MTNLILPKISSPGYSTDKHPICQLEVDWSHPYTQGLVVAWVAGQARANLAENRPLVLHGTTQQPKRKGMSLYFSTTGDYIETNRKASSLGLTGTKPRSAIAGISHTANNLTSSTGCCIHAWGTASGTGDDWEFVIEENNGATRDNRLRILMGNGTLVGSTTVADGTYHVVGYTFPEGSTDGSSTIFYVDGIAESSYSLDTGPTLNTSDSNIYLWDSWTGTRKFAGLSNGNGYFQFIWNRGLRKAEHYALSKNPYQILKPANDPFVSYYSTAAASFQAAWARNTNSIIQGVSL